MMNYWDSETLHTRIANPHNRLRHEAGSPNPQEVECYGRFLEMGLHQRIHTQSRKVVVLGMTPELRQLAHKMRCRVICVDNSAEAITLYIDWIAEEYRTNEHIIKADWMDLSDILEEPADAIIGDGVFGNVLSLNKYRELLHVFKESLHNEGFLILRTIMVPRNFAFSEHTTDRLIGQFRAGKITKAEFGFGMRIFGSYSGAYNTQSFILDNRMIFKRYEDWFKEGVLSDVEYTAIRCYYFEGPNLIPPQEIWEEILLDEGFTFQKLALEGSMWYEYYPIYYCYRTIHP